MVLFSLTEISAGSQEGTIKACISVDDRHALREAEYTGSKIKDSNNHADKYTNTEYTMWSTNGSQCECSGSSAGQRRMFAEVCWSAIKQGIYLAHWQRPSDMIIVLLLSNFLSISWCPAQLSQPAPLPYLFHFATCQFVPNQCLLSSKFSPWPIMGPDPSQWHVYSREKKMDKGGL